MAAFEKTAELAETSRIILSDRKVIYGTGWLSMSVMNNKTEDLSAIAYNVLKEYEIAPIKSLSYRAVRSKRYGGVVRRHQLLP